MLWESNTNNLYRNMITLMFEKQELIISEFRKYAIQIEWHLIKKYKKMIIISFFKPKWDLKTKIIKI